MLPIHRRPGELTRGKRLVAAKKGVAIFLGIWGLLIGLFLNPVIARAECQGVTSIYDDGIPLNVRIYCEVVGAEKNICPEILESIAYRESRYTIDAVNGDYKGLMQVNVVIHKDRLTKYGYTVSDMTNSAYANIQVAADYLAELYETYGDDNPIVLSVYSGNWKAVSDYKEYGWLCPYVEDVLTRSAELERVHGK